MKEKFIEVVKVSPQEKPEIVKIENTLTGLQKAVSVEAPYVGLIEIIQPDNEDDWKICLLCNEEGKILNLTPNRRVGDDIICGTFYIVRVKDGKLISLTDTDVVKYSIEYWAPESFTDDEIIDSWLF